MEPKESANARPRCLSCTHEQLEESASQPFAGLKTPLEDFYLSQTKRLSRIAAKVGVPPDQIDDVVQEVWSDAIEHSDGFQGEDVDQRLSSWLATVVRSKSMDVLRRIHRRLAESLDDVGAELIDHKAEDPEERIEAKEWAEGLAQRLDGLREKNPLNYRLVCEHVQEHRSLADLATETGLGVHAIACRISWTLKKMRGSFGE